MTNSLLLSNTLAITLAIRLSSFRIRNMKTVPPAFVLAIVFAMTYSCSTVQADITVGDYQNVGDGLLTIDSDTGLEWLDWTESRDISYNNIVAQFGVGGTYEGWRHATLVETRALVVAISGPALVTNWPAPTAIQDGTVAAGTFQSLLGTTFSEETLGITSDSSNPGVTRSVVEISIPGISSRSRIFEFDQSQQTFAYGHALVRASVGVPEPGSLLCLLGLGLVGVTRRRRNQ